MNRILKRIAIGNDLKKIIDTYGKGTVDSAILNELEQYTYSRDLLEESFPFNTGDYEENGDTYQELQDYTAQEALTYNVDLEEIANYLCDLLDIDNIDTEELCVSLDDYVNNDIYRQYEKAFDNSIEQYIKDNIYCGGVNEYGTEYNNENNTLSGKEVPDEFDNEDIMLDEISDLDDSIGDSSRITDIIDIDTRDNAFVYIDGKVIEGTNNETHSQILNKFCEENDITAPDNGCSYTGLRPIVDEVKQKLDTSKIAFGHFIGNIAFIEVCEGCSEADVVSALEEKYSPEKIYFYDREVDYINRLAKVVSDGDMCYADVKNKKYPCYDEKHIRAAWNYINVKRDADEYSDKEYKKVYDNIVKRWKEEIDPAGPPEYQKENK